MKSAISRRTFAKGLAGTAAALGGLGIAIISTSSGLLTQKECLDRGIGGEIVAFVW